LPSLGEAIAPNDGTQEQLNNFTKKNKTTPTHKDLRLFEVDFKLI
jgi:hypothetical protein